MTETSPPSRDGFARWAEAEKLLEHEGVVYIDDPLMPRVYEPLFLDTGKIDLLSMYMMDGKTRRAIVTDLLSFMMDVLDSAPHGLLARPFYTEAVMKKALPRMSWREQCPASV